MLHLLSVLFVFFFSLVGSANAISPRDLCLKKFQQTVPKGRVLAFETAQLDGDKIGERTYTSRFESEYLNPVNRPNYTNWKVKGKFFHLSSELNKIIVDYNQNRSMGDKPRIKVGDVFDYWYILSELNMSESSITKEEAYNQLIDYDTAEKVAGINIEFGNFLKDSGGGVMIMVKKCRCAISDISAIRSESVDSMNVDENRYARRTEVKCE